MRHDLLSRLKNETAACHARLENALDLMRDGLQRDAYIALLERFLGYVAPWEDAVGACMPASLRAFFDERRKAPLLVADLAALGAGRAIAHADPLRDLPRVTDVASAFGSLYVMEGSTLGGRFIAPHVARQLDLAPGVGNAYFDGYGPRTGSMWNAFRETAVAVVPQASYDDAVRAAIETFESLQTWLCAESSDECAQAAAGAVA
ncbi:biliverdin-producing heme oxygenase [Caballeronia sp. Lep1P3]|uniref:biliverdin-producing heme oxygenase n=1 Tax=Caballeronia sp. Lep1P3 TaxID=2878150 RepID=UPI001FCFC08A|nr:biliverdin-producing heme oxygenase [Caballeronia sp. Lep1P3]